MLNNNDNSIHDNKVLKLLNKELKKYHIKLKFKYYVSCPFKIFDDQLLNIILKHIENFDDYYSKIFILSSLGDEYFSECVPYLIDVYEYFIENIYAKPQDDLLMSILCETIRKIKCSKYTDLYAKLFEMKKTSSFESIINMISEMNMLNFEDKIFELIFKETLIPLSYIGLLSEDEKYWCSIVALKYIVNRKNKKYLSFFQRIINDENCCQIYFSDSKYKKTIETNLKKKYKKLAERGLKKLQ